MKEMDVCGYRGRRERRVEEKVSDVCICVYMRVKARTRKAKYHESKGTEEERERKNGFLYMAFIHYQHLL